jgi:hypothetical protein
MRGVNGRPSFSLADLTVELEVLKHSSASAVGAEERGAKIFTRCIFGCSLS